MLPESWDESKTDSKGETSHKFCTYDIDSKSLFTSKTKAVVF